MLIPRSFRRCLVALSQLLGLGSVLAQVPLAITDIRVDEAGRAVIRVPYSEDSYYILYRGEQVTAITTATAIGVSPTISPPAEVELADELLPFHSPAGFYRAEQVPLTAPRDSDNDGIDDAYELLHRPLLDPLSAADAKEDPDNDGRTTLVEYRARTNPFATDPPPPPAAPRLLLPPEATTAAFLDLVGSGPTNAYVRIEGGAALATNEVAPDGSFLVTVPLTPNRLNRLFVSAIDAQGVTSAGQPLEILQDSQPPSLFIDFPAATNGMTLTVEKTLVTGRVGDALSGYRGLDVWVHSSPAEGPVPTAGTTFPTNSPLHAQVDVGIGPNGTFHRADVPLVEGLNVLTVIAADLLGNRTFRAIELQRQPLPEIRLVALAGDLQATNALQRLPEPVKWGNGVGPVLFTFLPTLALRLSPVTAPISTSSVPILKCCRCSGISGMRCNRGSVLLRWVPSSPPAPPRGCHIVGRLARRWEA